jgi:hypothetical protein
MTITLGVLDVVGRSIILGVSDIVGRSCILGVSDVVGRSIILGVEVDEDSGIFMVTEGVGVAEDEGWSIIL